MLKGIARVGYYSDEEFVDTPQFPTEERMRKGLVAVMECLEEIPCNPCETSCNDDAIIIGKDITKIPELIGDNCTACLQCLIVCPGQAIFAVDNSLEDNRSILVVPYEFLPMPQKGDVVTLLDRAGQEVGEGTVQKKRLTKKTDKTALVFIEISRELAMVARAFRLKSSKS